MKRRIKKREGACPVKESEIIRVNEGKENF